MPCCVPVLSSWVQKIALVGGNLAVQFKSGGGWHRYPGTDEGTFHLMLAASSKGRFVRDFLRGRPSIPMAPPGACSGLVGHWKLNEGTGLIARDASGLTNHATLTNGPAWSADRPADAPPGGSLAFDGNDDYCLSSTAYCLPQGGAARTIALWFKVRSFPEDVYSAWVCLGNGGAAGQKFIVLLDYSWDGSQTANHIFTDGINVDNNIIVSGAEVPSLNAWHHFALTLDGHDQWEYYLDGALVKSGTFVTPLDTVTNAVEIGGRHDAVTGSMDGLLKDVRIYARRLPASIIAALAGA